MAILALASRTFDGWRYGNKTYAEFVADGDHPVFAKDSPVISDPKMREFRAAARFGYIIDGTLTMKGNNWLDLPRETRAIMTAFDILDGYTSAIVAEDVRKAAERQREAKSNATPRNGRRPR